MRYQVGPVASAIIVFITMLVIANFGYGLVHEAAHALVVKGLGGKVSEMYVNPAGLDGYIVHTEMVGHSAILVQLAGLIATTIVALVLTVAGKELIMPAFFALRTAIYALNYAPGTDISNAYALTGNTVFLVSTAILFVNAGTLAFVLLRHQNQRRQAHILKDPSSSLSRARPQHSSGE